MPIRICSICKEEKELTEFYRDSRKLHGREYRCKACKSMKQREYSKTPSGMEYQRSKRQRYSKANRSHETQLKREYRKNNPEKYAAHNAVQLAILSGQLSRPETCEGCEKEYEILHGHHDDYSKPLEVIWLCPLCHKKKH